MGVFWYKITNDSEESVAVILRTTLHEFGGSQGSDGILGCDAVHFVEKYRSFGVACCPLSSGPVAPTYQTTRRRP